MENMNRSPNGGVAHHAPQRMTWQDMNVYGTVLSGAVVSFGDHGVMSSFFKMARGDQFKKHKHREWVQVMVVSGALEVVQDGAEPFICRSGEVYFLEPGHPHVETAVEDSLVLVTTAENVPPPPKRRSGAAAAQPDARAAADTARV